jgi:hypothetical protein
MADVLPLPLLDDLMWCCYETTTLPPQLLGARPSMLDTFDMDLINWLEAADDSGHEPPPVTSPRVRALTLRLSQPSSCGIATFRACDDSLWTTGSIRCGLRVGSGRGAKHSDPHGLSDWPNL